MSNISAIWKLFTRLNDNSEKASCNNCNKTYTAKGGTTSSLINHLKAAHNELYEQYQLETKAKSKASNKRPAESMANSPFMKQQKIEDCIPESNDALDKAITDAIVDFLADSGVAFRVVGLPSFQRLMKIANRRIKLKHPTTYSRLVKSKAEEIKQELLDIIAAVKGDVSCIGFTTDLWTSRSGHPFMSLTVHIIDKDWELHRWTPFVAPFPARHTGKNIALGLDAMVEDLGLSGEQWELFAVNDNASNVKLAIKQSRHLKQYLCSIHTLELCVKGTFTKVQGMKSVLKKTKSIGTFTHTSTVATDDLKRECAKEKIKFKKVANPPSTRWSGCFDNLVSVLHLKKPLQNLTASNENWEGHTLTAAEWRLVEGSVKLLKPVRDTIKAWEAEIEPTMHRVIERIYSMHYIIDEFVANPANNMHGVLFARELKKQIEERFPSKGADNKLRRIANYLAPQFKGIHLEEIGKLDSTKAEIDVEVAKIALVNIQPTVEENGDELVAEATDVPVSPTTKLRNRMQARQQRMQTQFQNDQLSAVRREMLRYESFSLPSKNVNILHWWGDHEKVLPCLAKLAKKVLTVPASSSKSERVFSTGGNFVTAKRNKIAPKKVEELILIKENKSKIEDFKTRSSYKLKRVETDPFARISVDETLQNMVSREEADLDIFFGLGTEDAVDDKVLFFINDDDDDDEYDLDDTNDDYDEDIIDV